MPDGGPVHADAAFNGLLDRLAEAAPDLEPPDAWPGAQFEWLAKAGVLGWVIPRQYGGSEQPLSTVISGYERLAAACLTTTFVLTQRNGACTRIANGDSEPLKRELLPRLARGELFATVGVSHLTTSRQHLGQPAVHVAADPHGWRIHGQVPWVTGARCADYIVTGGTLDDGRQVLLAVPAQSAGLTVRDSARLLALSASQTASIDLDAVVVPPESLLAGPVAMVMSRDQGGGTGSIATSTLALGVAQRAIDLLRTEAGRRPELVEIVEPLCSEVAGLRADIYALASEEPARAQPRPDAAAIRQRANSLVLRCTQAALAASKGAGFVAGHPAERSVREAMFFLVWSCPQPVLTAALRQFACLAEV